MAIKATTATRAPRGTKTLTQAFFTAADGIPGAQRVDVVKAALAAIRDQLKDDREKAKLAKAKAKAKAGKAPVTSGAKAATPSPKKQSAAAARGKKVEAKSKLRAASKISSGPSSDTDAV